MSAHVAPHRWADALAGKLSTDERATIDRHADSCARCRAERTRVQRASDSFSSIRAQSAPELPWDSVRARVHWSVSKARRDGTPLPTTDRRRIPMVAWGLAAAAAVAGLVVVVTRDTSSSPEPVAVAPAPAPSPSPVVAPVEVAAPTPLVGLVTRARGDVFVLAESPARFVSNARDDLFAIPFGPGAVFSTVEGRFDLQFGNGSALALGPNSRLVLRQFDDKTIELVVDGTLDVEVGARAPEQRFLVNARGRVVEVRGTQFRVRTAVDAVEVACRHGLVAVRDHGGAEIEVAAKRGATIPSDQPLVPEHVEPLTDAALTELANATPLRMPVWDLATLTATSAPLDITAPGGRELRVDGVELGTGPMRVRMMPGRHMVEAADRVGRFRRIGWVDIAAPSAGGTRTVTRFEVPTEHEPTKSAGLATRKKQLRAGIDAARLSRCMRTIAKSGVTDTYVQIEIAVDASGAVGFLNVLDTDLPSTTATCVRDVLADVRFTAGPSATWRERIDL